MTKDTKGRPTADYGKMTPEQAAEYMSGMFGENADKVVDGKIKKAEEAVKKASKKKVDYTVDDADILAQEEEKKTAMEQAQKELDLYNDIKKAIVARRTAESLRNKKEEKHEPVQDEAAIDAATRKFQEAPKIEGRSGTITLPSGRKVKGRYMVVPAMSLTPSHDPFNGYKPSEGVPLDENGKTVNDRDYEHDKDAQTVTEEMGNDYGGQAVADVPVVNPDGKVISGNGRTMAGQLAAERGKDAAYVEALRENAGGFGIKAEDLDGVEHPRVVFVPDEALPYDTKTFAEFNKNEKKTQSNTQQAIAKSKTLTEKEVGAIVSEIEGSGSLDAFFNNPKAINELVKTLLEKGIIGRNEVAELMEAGGERLSPQGKELVKNLLLGGIFTGDTIQKMGIDSGLKNKVINGMRSIMQNMKLGEYSLRGEVDNAVSLVYEAKRAGMSVGDYLRQNNAFEENARDKYSHVEQALAQALDGSASLFRELMAEYNKVASARNTGEEEMFGERQTKDEFVEEFVEKSKTIKENDIKLFGNESERKGTEGKDDAAGDEKPASQAGSGAEETQRQVDEARGLLDQDLEAANAEYRNAQKMKITATGWFERRKQVAEKKAALARAQQAYDAVKAISDAYNAKYGKAETETEQQAEEEKETEQWSEQERAQKVEENRVLTDDTAEAMIGSQKFNAITKIAKLMGVNVVWLKHGDANGWFDHKDNTIYLALDAVNPVEMVFGHEMLHDIRTQSKTAYEALKATAKTVYGNRFNEIMQKKREAYEEFEKRKLTEEAQKQNLSEEDLKRRLAEIESAEHLLSDDYIEEETVADCIGATISRYDLAKDIALRLDHPTLFAWKKAVDKVAGLFGKTNPYGKQARALGDVIYDAYKRTRDKEQYSDEELKEMNKTAEQSMKADEAMRKAQEQAKTEQKAEEQQKEEDKTEEKQPTEDKSGELKMSLRDDEDDANAKISPIGTGAFGNIYNQFIGKANAAIKFLKSIGSGEAVGAIHHHSIGDISLVWGNKKAGLEKILKKHPEVVNNLQEIIDSMDVVLESDNRIKLESPTHFAVVSKEYNGTPRGNWLLTAYEKKDSLANSKTMNTATSSSEGDTALFQTKDAAKVDNSTDTSKGNKDNVSDDVKKSLREDTNHSLVGVHNITEEKLEKALKLGGLANPSIAVIDSDKQLHNGYGGISLIMPSEKIDKRTGKNAGTFFGDAWTPTYPQVERIFGKGGSEKAVRDIASVPKEMQRMTRNAVDAWLDGRDADGLAYLYLQERGKAPELMRMEGKYDKRLHEAMRDITQGKGLYGLGEEARNKVLDLMIGEKYGGDRKAYDEDMAMIARRQQEFLSKYPKSTLARKVREDLDWIERNGYEYDSLSRFVDEVNRDAKSAGEVSDSQTMLNAQKTIETDGLKQDFERWKDSLAERYGVKEVIFDGFTPSGKRRYVPNDLEHVSRIMKKKGLAGAEGSGFSFNQFASTIMEKTGSLSALRKRKGMLTENHADMDVFTEEWGKVYNELADAMNPTPSGIFDDTGYYRLAEAALQGDPKAYAKKEYGVDLTDRQVEGIRALVNAIRKERPAMYFETKFERPVMLNEFAAAVVPNDVKPSTKAALTDAGLSVVEYDPNKDGDRQRAFKEATQSRDDILFSIRSYHGSGAGFDRFDHSHMGEGEGAQAYGWGTYVTEVEGIGRTYAKNNTAKNAPKDYRAASIEYEEARSSVEDGEYEVDEIKADIGMLKDILDGLNEKYKKAKEKGLSYKYEDFENRIKYEEKILSERKDKLKIVEATLAEDKARMEAAKARLDSMPKPTRHLYTVEIPDDTGENYLDWDKPLSDEQKAMAADALASNPKKAAKFIWENSDMFGLSDRELVEMHDNPESFSADDYAYLMGKNLNAKNTRGENIYRGLQKILGSDKAASLALNKAGFTGIRYPADFRRGGREDGKKNYVIFNENDAKIVEHERFSLRENVQKEVDSILSKAKKDGTYMKAPNGIASNLDETHWALVRTKNFKAWFGDWETDPEDASQIVDENREPKVFYHNTDASFTSFDGKRNGSHTDAGWLGDGFYFYGDKNEGNGYGRNKMAVYLDIRNPYYATEDDVEKLSAANNREESIAFRQKLEDDGYDGVYYNGDLRQEAVAFYPNQIKSATDNNGDFSEGNDDIRFSFGDSYDYLKYPKGRAEPGLADKQVNIVSADINHGFKNYREAKEWAEKNICKTYTNEETGGKGNVKIDSDVVDKYISKSARLKSDSEDLHYAVLKVLPEMIRYGVDAETHPNFRKVDGIRSIENGYDTNLLMHRVYAAVEVGGNLCRVKISMKENMTRMGVPTKPYSYEVTGISTKIEPLETIDVQARSEDGISKNSITGAKLLKGVEMSYDKVKKLLDESEKMSSDPLFSIRDSYDTKLSKWKARNGLADDAQPMEKPVRGADESLGDFMNRMAQYAKDQALWKTAPRPTGFSEALEQWKKDNGIPADEFRPSVPRKADYATDDEYKQARDQYKAEMEKWKGAPKVYYKRRQILVSVFAFCCLLV